MKNIQRKQTNCAIVLGGDLKLREIPPLKALKKNTPVFTTDPDAVE